MALRYCILALVFALPGGWCFTAQAQQFESRFTNQQNWMMTSGSALVAGGSFLLQRSTPVFTEADLRQMETRTFSGIAAYPAGRYDLRAARTSDWLVLAAAALPATALLFEEGRSEIGQGLHMYGQVLFVNYAVTNLTKTLVRRPRPYAYNPNVPDHIRMERDARFSFFSGHASTASSFSFFTAAVIHRYSDSRAVRTAAWIGAAVLPAITGYYRMRAGKHFFSDVLVGYAAGAVVGVSVPLLHRTQFELH